MRLLAGTRWTLHACVPGSRWQQQAHGRRERSAHTFKGDGGYRYDRLMAPGGPVMTKGEKLTGYAPGFGRLLLLRPPTMSSLARKWYPIWGNLLEHFFKSAEGNSVHEVSFTTHQPQ